MGKPVLESMFNYLKILDMTGQTIDDEGNVVDKPKPLTVRRWGAVDVGSKSGWAFADFDGDGNMVAVDMRDIYSESDVARSISMGRTLDATLYKDTPEGIVPVTQKVAAPVRRPPANNRQQRRIEEANQRRNARRKG